MSSRNSHNNNPEGHNQYTKNNNNNNSGRDYDNDDDNNDSRRNTGRHSNNPEGHNQYTKNSNSNSDDNDNRRSSGNRSHSNNSNSNSNNSNNNQQGQGLQEGDHVTYHPIGSGDSNTATSTGTITQVLTEDTVVGSGSDKRSQPTVHASEDEPRYVIENDNTGKQTAYKAGNIEGSA
ncbi:hypothetical protein RI367_001883 [Sorochytrium milnesiophthora]